VPKLKEIADEWDRNASSRCQQIEAGNDISHDKVLLPTILGLAGSLRGSLVLDVGCGCGFLTFEAACHAKRVLGIDISQQMIREAELRHRRKNLSFKCVSLGAFARAPTQSFDICLANMSIITMSDLRSSLIALSRLLRPGGVLVFSITHPCFWHAYRRDEPQSKFNYWRPHPVKAPFRITFDKKPLPTRTTYFHRPLSQYFSCLRHAKLQVEEVIEPNPTSGVPRAYRKAFPFPRFLVFRARKL
jgi:SAM-dependent methyltransferase